MFSSFCKGPIAGMRCTQILEIADPHTWADNYFCVPHQSPYQFSWNSAAPVPGAHCIRWLEPSDPHTWADNHLCAPQFCNLQSCPGMYDNHGSINYRNILRVDSLGYIPPIP